MIKNIKNLQNYNQFHYFVILFFSILIISPIIIKGVPAGKADFIHHLQISNAFFDSLKQGIIYPNWVFSENLGYGAVTVRFYPPLIHYSLAIFRIFTGDWQLSIFTTFTLWSFIGGLGIFTLTRDFLKNRWQATVSAILFVLAPYHLNQFYNSFMFGEFVALSILPFGFYFAKKLCERGRISDVLGFAISMALLILSNLPQAIISTICIGFYILLHLKKGFILRQISQLTAGSLLALACSAFYWVRMIAEMQNIYVSQPNTDPAYDYRNHFLSLSFSFDDQGVWFASLIFFILILTTLFALTVSGKFKASWENKNIKNICLLNLFSVFMILPVSKFIWDNLIFLQKVQFPWRFLSILTLGISIILGYCLEFINTENLHKKRPSILLLIGIILIFLTFSIKQVALGADFLDSSNFSEIAKKSVQAKGLKHWLPVWSNEQTFDEKSVVLANGREIHIDSWETERREFSVAKGNSTQARLAILYYPHWKAFVNNTETQVFAGKDGATNLDLSGEFSKVKLLFVEPQYSLVSRKISFLACAFVFLLICFQFFSFFKFKSK